MEIWTQQIVLMLPLFQAHISIQKGYGKKIVSLQ